MEQVAGKMEAMSRSFNNGWRIAEVKGVGKVVGELPDNIEVGDHCVFYGEWSDHPRYGRQFKASQARIDIPKDVAGRRTYLERSLPNVGPVMAATLIEKFGDTLFDIIEKDPSKLIEIKGITEDRARLIHEEYLSVRRDREADIFFATHGISTGTANRLKEKYQTKVRAVEKIKRNPYRLADEVWGIGFKRADAIAMSIGIKKDSHLRLRSGIIYVMGEASGTDGHCCLPREELVDRACSILEVGKDAIEGIIDFSVEAGALTLDGEMVYEWEIYRAEQYIASKLRALAGITNPVGLEYLDPNIVKGMDEDQRIGLESALTHNILLITGGPGVGKTFLISKIIDAIKDNRSISLAAPTGKAAKRMNEATGMEAKTIHRLLEYSPSYGGFQRGSNNPIGCDTLIVDEVSMIDVHLMCSLLMAISPKTQVIFVGDPDQLPSVGPGRILTDMLESGVIPTATLKKLHRQSEDSFINTNAQLVNAGKKMEYPQRGDFWFIEEKESEKLPGKIVDVVKSITSKFDRFEFDNVQILCPQKKGHAGAHVLNECLRPVMNADGQKIEGTTFLTGDRVIQTKNNYDLGVFNGDIGKIQGFYYDETFTGIKKLVVNVVFDEGANERIVGYSGEYLFDLQLAYALTIHKSQGSEFEVVIIPIHTTNYRMLRRNLLYTAITRAKKMCVLVGTMKGISVATRTIDTTKRYSGLIEALRSECNE